MTASDPITILIVDDHPIVRQGVRSLLSNYAEFEIVGECENGTLALDFVRETQPNIMLLDIRMPGLSGIEVLHRLKITYPDIKVLMLTSFDDDEYVKAALRAGAQGYVLKSVSDDYLVEVIYSVHRGERVLSPQVTERVVQQLIANDAADSDPENALNTEEIGLLKLLAAGANNNEIADQLFMSTATVKRKMRKILEKMKVQTRVQAVAEAVRQGII